MNLQMQSHMVCPIFNISCTNLLGIDLFKNFLSNLPFSDRGENIDKKAEQCEFHVSRAKFKDNAIILIGVVHQGTFKEGQKTVLGPIADGSFHDVEIMEIRCCYVPVEQVNAGQMCSMLVSYANKCKKCFSSIKDQVRKGMVLLDSDKTQDKRASFSFKAEIWTYNRKSVSVKKSFEPFVHVQQVQQSCKIFFDSQDTEKLKGFKKRSDKKFDQIYLLKNKQSVVGSKDENMFNFNQKNKLN